MVSGTTAVPEEPPGNTSHPDSAPQLLRQILGLHEDHHVHTVRSTDHVSLYRVGNYAARVSDHAEPHLAHRSAHLHRLGIPTPRVHHSGPLGQQWATITTWHEPTHAPNWSHTAEHLRTLNDSHIPGTKNLLDTLITPKLNAAAQHIATAPNALIRVIASRHHILRSARERYGVGTLHGDLHHGNLLGTPQGTYLIDLEHVSYDTLAWDLVPAASRGRRFDENWQPYHALARTWQNDPLHDPEFIRLCLLREAIQTLGSLVRANAHPHDTSLAHQARRRVQTWHGRHQSWAAW